MLRQVQHFSRMCTYKHTAISLWMHLKAFSALFFAHPIAQVFRSLKNQELRV